jgi:hypothetical protein
LAANVSTYVKYVNTFVCWNYLCKIVLLCISILYSAYPFLAGVSMQRLSATIAVMPKGRIINSCTVDHWTVFMLIMETQVSKLIAGSLNNPRYMAGLNATSLSLHTSSSAHPNMGHYVLIVKDYR